MPLTNTNQCPTHFTRPKSMPHPFYTAKINAPPILHGQNQCPTHFTRSKSMPHPFYTVKINAPPILHGQNEESIKIFIGISIVSCSMCYLSWTLLIRGPFRFLPTPATVIRAWLPNSSWTSHCDRIFANMNLKMFVAPLVLYFLFDMINVPHCPAKCLRPIRPPALCVLSVFVSSFGAV